MANPERIPAGRESLHVLWGAVEMSDSETDSEAEMNESKATASRRNRLWQKQSAVAKSVKSQTILLRADEDVADEGPCPSRVPLPTHFHRASPGCLFAEAQGFSAPAKPAMFDAEVQHQWRSEDTTLSDFASEDDGALPFYASEMSTDAPLYASEEVPQNLYASEGSDFDAVSEEQQRVLEWVQATGRSLLHAQRLEEDDRNAKLRPCKGKRERYKKLIARLQEQIEKDPLNFQLDFDKLPHFVASNEAAKMKVVASVNQLIRRCMAERARMARA